jgi:hypothetical protein
LTQKTGSKTRVDGERGWSNTGLIASGLDRPGRLASSFEPNALPTILSAAAIVVDPQAFAAEGGPLNDVTDWYVPALSVWYDRPSVGILFPSSMLIGFGSTVDVVWLPWIRRLLWDREAFEDASPYSDVKAVTCVPAEDGLGGLAD